MSECPSIVCCPDDPFETPVSAEATSYWNTQQCATVSCAGEEDTATACIPANTYSSTTSQAAADAAALAQATANAQAMLSCAYTSTQEACIDCPGGDVVAIVSYVGTVFTSGGLIADTGASSTVESYAVVVWTVPFDSFTVGWYMQGSDDLLTWNTLDTQSGIANDGVSHTYTLAAMATYRYFRLLSSGVGEARWTAQFDLFGPSSAQICKTASASSLVSQGAADAAAYAAALDLAMAECSGSGTGESENTTAIVLPAAAWGESFYAAADVYPSIINIAGIVIEC